jgi:hypothetical protein
MGLLTELLKDAPLSAVLQEKVKAFEVKVAELEQQLEDCRRLYQVSKDENKNLSALLAEDVLFHGGVCFKRGRATGNKWMPFCVVCGLPLRAVEGFEFRGLVCANAPKCLGRSEFPAADLAAVVSGL